MTWTRVTKPPIEVTMKTEVETVQCKKCGEQHRVDSYRDVKHYVCPHVNRVILLVQDEETPDTNEKFEQRYV